MKRLEVKMLLPFPLSSAALDCFYDLDKVSRWICLFNDHQLTPPLDLTAYRLTLF
jgi:hypothetical protein